MHSLIPVPAEFAPGNAFFVLNHDARILVEPTAPEVLRVGNFLANALRPATGLALPVMSAANAAARGNILLALNDERALGDEGYTLEITPAAVTLRAPRAAGLFYGVQTLRQLFPPAIESQTQQNEIRRVPTGMVRDAPRYAWRGAMLDVARHFFKVAEVKRFIDLLARYKMNRLHLHLSDDQGWRIEIKAWDNLTTIGGSTGVDGKNGGYFTQAEYRELAAYAAEQYITLVPEIDTPGHTNAALASYAELNRDGVARELYTGSEVGFSSLCIDKEITYKFLDDVIRELAALTPGAYIHIGGDEAHATAADAYKKFIQRVEKIVQAHSKQMVGWEEIAQANISPQTVAQIWRGEHGARAVAQGVRVILSPASKTYLDMQYDETSPLGLHWAGYLEVRDAYDWNPETLLQGVGAENILGVEAPLWSETLVTLRDIEYMALPRLTAIAEIGWSPQAQRDWHAYRARVAAQGARWQLMGLNYYRSPQIDW
jgi:hexosaminidase